MLVASTILVAGLFALGAWQRRWISDDGLIVLRTIRHLIAGNGPVFNAGERVEANTSTLWTYLVYMGTWIPGAGPEGVVLVLALALSVAAIVLAVMGGARLYSGTSSASFLLPAGVIAYIAVPPARDFATSGLESGLVIAWIALLWWLMLGWARQPRAEARSTILVAFVAGLGPLVRPELAVLGGLAILLLLSADVRWRFRALLIAAAGALPVAYQIFRMGYYGLPFPNTAVAKDAGGSRWSQGWLYFQDLVGPYLLWLPLAAMAIGGIAAWLLVRSQRGSEQPAPQRSRSRSRAAVVALFLLNGILLGIYVVRVGGDFMHGRTLLPVLFTLLLPVAVIPIVLPTRQWLASAGRRAVAGIVAPVAWIVVVAWSVTVVVVAEPRVSVEIPDSGIVDERAFYAEKTGIEHPTSAEHYVQYPRMRSLLLVLDTAPRGSVLLPTADEGSWVYVPPKDPASLDDARATVYYAQLGMAGMIMPLDVRVLDHIGLAYPLAAHTERIEGGRIGHDKYLYPDWLIADYGGADTWETGLIGFLDPQWVQDAQRALSCEATRSALGSYRDELTIRRFLRNIVDAFPRSGYRIERAPLDEIERCDTLES
ncbi:flagellar motor control protein ZomB [Lolliginicoccus suaedae]|uniref:flagellar motor control protein ZomB n=1 Tax=Lolliginicoccus suaedae TaxID=2605429 RepID=UPI001F3C0C90|nr:flagellar motor control protein ZomB [Lolliginicoccus suaedae]